MIVLWFIGAVFGALVVVAELAVLFFDKDFGGIITVHLPELLSYIEIPMSCAIAGYLAKSAFENREKIKNNPGYLSGGNGV
jgi:hypothetical protein